jgi:two-component system CheB/CheR fusion protein
LKYTPRGRILLGCRRHGDALCIEVHDTGIGIPTDLVGSIFEDFYKVSPSPGEAGSSFGVGLYIVEQLARMLGHVVDVRSAPGAGSMFAVTVPLLHHRDGTDAAHASEPAGNPDTASILVIEDDDAQRDTLQLLLQAQGYAVRTARTRAEALGLAGIASGFRPDVAVADYNLGDGLNGLDVVREVAAIGGRPLPALMMTGDMSEQTARAVFAAGMLLLHKAVRLDDLLEAGRSMVGHAGRKLQSPARPRPDAEPAGAAGQKSIAIVEDDSEVREAIREVLAAHGHHTVGYANAEAFLDDLGAPSFAAMPAFAAVVVDVGLPSITGLELQRHLTQAGTPPPLIFVTGAGDVAVAVQAMRDGAADFLAKPVRAAALLESVDRVLARDAGARADVITRSDIEERLADLPPGSATCSTGSSMGSPTKSSPPT